MSVLTLAGKAINYAKPPKATTKVMWSRKDMYGRKVTGSFRTIAHLDYTNALAVKKFKQNIVVIQPPFNTTVAASAGTHDYDACLDVYIPGVAWAEQQKFFRANGWGAYWRKPPKFGHHIHMFSLPPQEGKVRADDWKVAGFKVGLYVDGGWSTRGRVVASAQIDAYYNGRDGLASNAKDLSWRPANIKSTIFDLKAYVKSKAKRPAQEIKVVGFNLPAPGVGVGSDLGDDDERIKHATTLIMSANPHIVAWNELGPVKSLTGGINGQAKSSAFAEKAHLSIKAKRDFALVRPTTHHNENYLSYRSDLLTLVKQYPDKILTAGTGGRHITRALLKHKKNGLVFAVGVTHLVNGSTAQHEADRQSQAKQAHAAMKEITNANSNCPFIIVGDMNTAADLKALVDGGMKRSRKWADKTRAATATYTPYKNEAPSTDPKREIDQTYFSMAWYVLEYRILRRVSQGKYLKPRPSDHDATYSSARA